MALQLRHFTPKVEVELAERLRRYEVEQGDEGWLYYDRMPQLFDQEKLWSTYFAAGTYLEFGGTATPHCLCVDREHLRGLMLRPYLRSAPKIVSGHVEVFDTNIATYAGDEAWMLDEMAFYPSNTDAWDFTRSEDGLFVECTQRWLKDESDDYTLARLAYQGTNTGPIGGDPTYVGACPNVFFAAGVRRQALADELLDYLETAVSYSEAYYTLIYFGNLRWCLKVPLIGEPTLLENVAHVAAPPGWTYDYPATWVQRQWTEGKLSAVSARRAADEGLTYRIGAMGHCICVSESNFEDDFAYFKVGNDTEPVIPAGPITIENWPGQCTLWLDLLEFAEDAYAYRVPFEIESYREDDQYHVGWGTPLEPLDDVDDGAIGYPSVGQLVGAAQYMHYSVPMLRGSYPSDAKVIEDGLTDELLTYTTPLLEAVTLYQDVSLTDHAGPVFTDVDNATLDLSLVESLGDGASQNHTIAFDNRQQSATPDPAKGVEDFVPTADLTTGRMLKIKAGWVYKQWDDGVVPPVVTEIEALVDQGHFFIISPTRDYKQAQFGITDLLGMLNLARVETEFCARGWYVNDLSAWVCETLGIGADWYEFEDTDAYVTEDGDDATWKIGTPWGQVLRELWERFGREAALWYDGQENKLKSCCPYCRTARTAADYLTHQDNGYLSSGCLAADAARIVGGVDLILVDNPTLASDDDSMYICTSLSCRVSALEADNYANKIIVIGQSEGPGQQQIIRTWTNVSALHPDGGGILAADYVGFPITHIEEDSSLTTVDAVNARLVELIHKLAAWPRTINATMPFHSTLRPGEVCQVEGGGYADIHNVKFRITNVSHNLKSMETTIEAREMRGVNLEVA